MRIPKIKVNKVSTDNIFLPLSKEIDSMYEYATKKMKEEAAQ